MANAADDTSKSENPNGGEPKYVTQDSLNSAIRDHVGRATKKFEESLEAKFASFAESLKPKTKTETPAEKSDDGNDDPIASLKAEVERLKADSLASKKEAKAARLAAAEKEAYSVLRSELAASGKVRPEAIDAVVRLIKSDGRIKVKDTGEFHYELDSDDGPRTGTITEGITAFMSSKDGALFAPVKAQLSRSARGPSSGSALPNDKDARTAKLDALIRDGLPGFSTNR